MEQANTTITISKKDGSNILDIEKIINDKFITNKELDFNKVYTKEERIEDFYNSIDNNKIKILDGSWVTIFDKKSKEIIEGRISFSNNDHILLSSSKIGGKILQESQNIKDFLNKYEIKDISLENVANTLDLYSSYLINDDIESGDEKRYVISFSYNKINNDNIEFSISINENNGGDYKLIDEIKRSYKRGEDVENLLHNAKRLLDFHDIDYKDFKIDRHTFNQIRGELEKYQILINHDLLNSNLDKADKISQLVLNFNTNYEAPLKLLQKLSKKLSNYVETNNSILIEGEYIEPLDLENLKGEFLFENGRVVKHIIKNNKLENIFGIDFIKNNVRINGEIIEVKDNDETWQQRDIALDIFNNNIHDNIIYRVSGKEVSWEYDNLKDAKKAYLKLIEGTNKEYSIEKVKNLETNNGHIFKVDVNVEDIKDNIIQNKNKIKLNKKKLK